VTVPMGPFGGLFDADRGGDRRITIADVERQFRSLTGTAEGALQASKSSAATVVVAAGVLVVTFSYLLGRRRGKRRSSVLEIRRI